MTAATAAGWAARLSRRDAAQLGELWSAADAEVCDAGDIVWVRGSEWSDALERRLRKISGTGLFRADAEGLLTPLECLLPSERLPAGPWRSLRTWLEVRLPAAVWPGKLDRRVTIAIVRAESPCSAHATEASAMLIPLPAFAAYVETAPLVRLRRWSFAVNDRAIVLVRGLPRPPLPGALLVDCHGVLVPAGYRWAPEIDAAALRRVMKLAEGELALFDAAGAWQRIDADALVAVSRSAVRATVELFRRREAPR